MWIKSKLQPDAKWKRITYQEWNKYPPFAKHNYEIKDESPQTDKQKLAMLKGRIIRHTMAADAQAAIALRHMNELLEQETSDDLERDTAIACSDLNLAKIYIKDSLLSLEHWKTKQKESQSLS